MRIDKKYFVVLLVLVFFVIFFSTVGQRGIVRVHRLTEETDQIKTLNEKIRQENRNLKEEIDLLKRDLKRIDKIARQELGLVKEDEIIYQFRASGTEHGVLDKKLEKDIDSVY